MNLDPRFRRELDERLSSFSPYPRSNFSGFGLVICAGGASYFTNAYVLIHVLRRHLNCTLPIEVWHIGKQEMSSRMTFLLEELDVRVVDAEMEMSAHEASIVDGWQLKPFAMMWSRFQHVLLLDADQVPVRRLADMTQWPEYEQSGAVLWPDLPDLLAENPVWEACGLTPRRVTSIESGQILFDKSRKWDALQLAFHLNERARYYYNMVYGDKDTFLLALLLTNSPFALIPSAPASDRGLCLYQYDFFGELLFQHRTGAKWRYSGEQENLPGFMQEEACRSALDELRQKWNGLIFHAPIRNQRALEAEARLSGCDEIVFLIPGQGPVRLGLLPGGEIGEGRAADRMNWCCEDDGGKIHLLLCDAFGQTWRLTNMGDYRWYGRSIVDPAVEAFLAAGAPHTPSMPPSPRSTWAKWPMPGRYSDSQESDFA